MPCQAVHLNKPPPAKSSLAFHVLNEREAAERATFTLELVGQATNATGGLRIWINGMVVAPEATAPANGGRVVLRNGKQEDAATLFVAERDDGARCLPGGIGVWRPPPAPPSPPSPPPSPPPPSPPPPSP